MYNITESEEDQQKSIELGIDLLQQNDMSIWKERRDKMLRDRIDVTEFLCWIVNNYPNSKQVLIENPDYQYRFK